ncbi:Hypothetical predicted protein [Mytilus galloprovincialis]|uniref:Uncharacterized protein n=1 Tax=Mytilus galloprovincialis TaxID=29158 RepID=A0A8B6BKV7_MYTGA|nr:Hypothetical predicted protein [Mytilus galloprovincialis]
MAPLVLNVSRFTEVSDPDTAEDATVHLGLFYLLLVGENVSISLGYDSIPDEGASYAEELGIATGVAVWWWLTEVISEANKVDVIMEVPYSIILSGIAGTNIVDPEMGSLSRLATFNITGKNDSDIKLLTPMFI